jgi:membrane associated rhomboid family serine protease
MALAASVSVSASSRGGLPRGRLPAMFGRQRSGSVVCPSCGRLVGVSDPVCLNCGRRNPGMWGFTALFRRLGQDLGFVNLVIGGCAALYVACLIVDPSGIGMTGVFGFLGPSRASLFVFGASGPLPVLALHRWWTVLSAGWLHAGLLHILFNVLWIRQLAPAVAELYGAGRMVIIYTVASAVGFTFSSLSVFVPVLSHLLGGGGFTVGASAAIFGLLGAMVHYGRRGSSSIGQQAWMWAAILFVFGYVMKGVDNWAHLGGFVGGWGISWWLNPLKPEKVDHVIAAVACLVLTVASIVVSVVTGLALLPGH